MAYIRLQGGLGNQLFIWSAAHYLSRITNGPIKLVSNPDNVHVLIQQLANVTQRDIKLVPGKLARIFFKLCEIARAKNRRLFDFINRNYMYFSEQQDLEIPIEILAEAFLVEGFFQRAWIVEEVWDTLSTEIDAAMMFFSEYCPEVQNMETALHVRRGDYVLSPNTWGLLSLRYYQEVLGNLEGVLCFTDMKIDQANDFFQKISGIQILTPVQSNEIGVLLALSKMRKVVIANSSLSWWGGFIAAKRGAIVIAPNPWFLHSASWSEEIFPSVFIRNKAIFTSH